MKIFPAIDIKDKKCVRLVKGDFDNKTEYEMSPVEQAGKYKDHGFKNLHIVDAPVSGGMDQYLRAMGAFRQN